MGFRLFSSWSHLWFCGRTWFKRLIIYSLICAVLYAPFQTYANPLLARVLLTEVLEGIVARRAVVGVAGEVAANDAAFLAANEAMIGMRTAQTYRALGTVAANDATFAVGATSTLRHAKDISWVALALGSGAITLSDLNVESNDHIAVSFEPSAVPLADGRYAIQVNGETKIVTAQPSVKDPVIYQYSKEKKQISDSSSEVYKSDVLDNDYHYFDTLRTGEYAQSNSIRKLSEYISQEEYGGKGETNYSEVEINGKKHQYLYSETTVQNTYLRHKQIGDNIYPEVRQTFTEKQLRYDFNPIIMGVTGNGTDNEVVYSFNPPKSSDYELSTRVTNITYISFEENENWVGDFQTKPQEMQIGSIADLNLGLYTQPLTATQLATLYNALLMSAATQPNYQGIPFSSANPITASEVQAELAKLGVNPTYADLFTKAGVGDKLQFGTQSQPLPEPNPRPIPNNRPDEIDIDDEPEYPELEPPTARQILEPFNQFFPQLKNFHLSERSVQCPTWEGHIDYLNIDVRLDKHCQYVEQNKALISTLMLLIWGIIALRILLSA